MGLKTNDIKLIFENLLKRTNWIKDNVVVLGL